MRPVVLVLLLALISACGPPEPTPTPPPDQLSAQLDELIDLLKPPTPTHPPPTATLSSTATPTATPLLTATPSPAPTPTHSPTPTMTPDQVYDLDYAHGFASWEQCGDIVPYRDAVARGYGQGYVDGTLDAEAALCPPPTPTPRPTATATPTPIPRQPVTAPAEVWACFMARDDSVRDENGTVLSPCGWRESLSDDLSVSPFWHQGHDWTLVFSSEADDDDRARQVDLLLAVLGRLSLWLRIGFSIAPADTEHDGAIYITFEDVERVQCGTAWVGGCASRVWNDVQTVSIAARNKSDEALYGLIMHELLHILARMSHATAGIMSTGAHSDGSWSLSDMDIAQLWLFSNPAFHTPASAPFSEQVQVEDIYAMMRFGEWEEEPPNIKEADCWDEERGEFLYLRCDPA